MIISDKDLYYVEKYISTVSAIYFSGGEVVNIPVTVTAPAGGGLVVFWSARDWGPVIGEVRRRA